MLWAKHGFAQSKGCPTQSSDRYTFAQQTMDLLPNYSPGIVRTVPCAKYGISGQEFALF